MRYVNICEKKKYYYHKMTTAYDKFVSTFNNAINAGDVVDVSKLTDDGTGARRHPVPKSTAGTKKWVPGFPVISDNYESYARAINFLGVAYAPYSGEYLRLYGAGKQTRGAAAAAARPTATTPFPVATTVVNPALLAAVTIKGPKSPRAKAAKSPRAKAAKAKAAKAKTPAAQRIPAIPATAYSPGIRPAVPVVPRPVSPPRTVVPFFPTARPVSPPRTVIAPFPAVRPISPPRATVPVIPIVRPASPRFQATLPAGTAFPGTLRVPAVMGTQANVRI